MYGALVASAVGQYGETVTLRRRVVGAGPADTTASAAVREPTERQLDGATILAGDRWYVVDGPVFSTEPKPSEWFVVHGGVERRVVLVRASRIAGQVVAYQLLVRG